jgi:hypothetical protein
MKDKIVIVLVIVAILVIGTMVVKHLQEIQATIKKTK